MHNKGLWRKLEGCVLWDASRYRLGRIDDKFIRECISVEAHISGTTVIFLYLQMHVHHMKMYVF